MSGNFYYIIRGYADRAVAVEGSRVLRRSPWLALLMRRACQRAARVDGGGFFRQYEYEEEVYLSLDGTATVYVNARWRR